jgi:hypothetical protein
MTTIIGLSVVLVAFLVTGPVEVATGLSDADQVFVDQMVSETDEAMQMDGAVSRLAPSNAASQSDDAAVRIAIQRDRVLSRLQADAQVPEPQVSLLEVNSGGAPAPAAPAPPSPAEIAAAAAAAEKMKKGDEKTKKKVSEENRKHAKRDAWRKTQQAKLKKVTDEPNVKISKEAAKKAKLQAKAKKSNDEVSAKQAAIKLKTHKLKADAMAKAAALTAKNKALKTKMQAKLAAIKGASAENDVKVVSKVQASITAKQAAAKAKQVLRMAKILKASDDKQVATKKKMDDDIGAITKQEADDAAARKKLADDRSAYQDKMDQKDKKYDADMDAKDAAFKNGKLQKLITKEVATKAAKQKETEANIAEKLKHSPGAMKVARLARRQQQQVEQLRHEVTRDDRRAMAAATKRFNHMIGSSKQAIGGVLGSEMHALQAGASTLQKEDAPKAERLLGEAWEYAVGGPADKAEAEAVTVARGGSQHLMPGMQLESVDRIGAHKALTSAWHRAYGQHSPQPHVQAGEVPDIARKAFANALGVSSEHADVQQARKTNKQELATAWKVAMGAMPHPQVEQSLAEQATGFNMHPEAPPAEDDTVSTLLSGHSAVAPLPKDEVEVALAAHQGLLGGGMPPIDQQILQQRAPARPWMQAANPEASANAAVDRLLAREEKEALTVTDSLLDDGNTSHSAPPQEEEVQQQSQVQPHKHTTASKGESRLREQAAEVLQAALSEERQEHTRKEHTRKEHTAQHVTQPGSGDADETLVEGEVSAKSKKNTVSSKDAGSDAGSDTWCTVTCSVLTFGGVSAVLGVAAVAFHRNQNKAHY